MAVHNAYGICARDIPFDLGRIFGKRLGAEMTTFAQSIGTSSQFLLGALLFAWSAAVGANAFYEVRADFPFFRCFVLLHVPFFCWGDLMENLVRTQIFYW